MKQFVRIVVFMEFCERIDNLMNESDSLVVWSLWIVDRIERVGWMGREVGSSRETRGRRDDKLNEGTSGQDATNELRNNYLLLPDCHIVASRPVCPIKIAR